MLLERCQGFCGCGSGCRVGGYLGIKGGQEGLLLPLLPIQALHLQLGCLLPSESKPKLPSVTPFLYVSHDPGLDFCAMG